MNTKHISLHSIHSYCCLCLRCEAGRRTNSFLHIAVCPYCTVCLWGGVCVNTNSNRCNRFSRAFNVNSLSLWGTHDDIMCDALWKLQHIHILGQLEPTGLTYTVRPSDMETSDRLRGVGCSGEAHTTHCASLMARLRQRGELDLIRELHNREGKCKWLAADVNCPVDIHMPHSRLERERESKREEEREK